MKTNVDNPTEKTFNPTVQTGRGYAQAQVYQNTTSKPIFVVVSLSANGAGNNTIVALCDSAVAPSSQVCKFVHDGTAAAATGSLVFIVLPNYYYEVLPQSGNFTMSQWMEWT
jgi:hypothetical protein